MESQDQSSLLRMPTPDRDGLSFCAANPANFATWLAALPKANLGETARLLHQAAQELTQLHAGASLRLQLLELLRPEIAYVCKQLERFFFNQPLVLGDRPRQVAGLCQALQKYLALGYKQVALALNARPGRDRDSQHALTVALQRAIHSLCALQIRASQLYNPSPAGLWLELHQLYALAVEHGVQDKPVTDDVALHARAPSVQSSYVSALLLGCARCNQMRQRSIAQLAELLEAWSGLVRLQPASAEGSLLAFSPRADEPPRYRSLFEPQAISQLLGIDPGNLVAEISAHLDTPGAGSARLPLPNGVSTDLLQQLGATLSEISERTFHRAPAQGTLRLCIGMSSLHYHLAGRRLFSDLLKHPVTPRGTLFETRGGASDIWAHAFDALPTDNDLFADQSIDYVKPSDETHALDEHAESYPIFDVGLVNHSPGGYCLAWSQKVPDQLHAGELVGLQDRDSEEWRVAVVRWLRQARGGGLQMGIELIAPEAHPCGLKLVRREQGSAYLRALLLPEIAALSKPASLLAPRLPFQEGHKVLINQHGDEHRAILGARQSGTASYNQFDYEVVGRLGAEYQQPSTGAGAGAGAAVPARDDFGLLWPSL
jgi:hypothetical protein